MSRTLSANSQTETDRPVTRPVWLAKIGETLLLSSREQITIGDDVYVAGAIKQVDLRSKRLAIFNRDLQWSAQFLSGTAGISAQIWKAWGEGPFAAADLDLWFDGELGAAIVGPTIEVSLRSAPPLQTPRLYVTPPTFNHLPPQGTKIITPVGDFILEGSE